MLNENTQTISPGEEEQSPLPVATEEGKLSHSRKHIFLLVIICCAVFFPSTIFYAKNDRASGDEPHYLIITQTLLLYHSLNISLDYQNRDYLVFYKGRLTPFQHISLNKWGDILPLHSIGVPLLWVIPFALDGRMGTLLFNSLLSVFTILNVYLLLVLLRIKRNYAFLVSLSLVVASPIYVFSYHNFVEPVAAVVTVYIVRVLFEKNLTTWSLLNCSIALGLLPLIHIRFALFEITLLGFLLYRIYWEYRFTNLSLYLSALLPLVAMFVLFEAYNLRFWGSLNPAVNQTNSHEVPFDTAPWKGLFGLFYDQEVGLFTNFPIFLFLPGGILLAWKKQFRRYNLMVFLLGVPYIIMIASFHNWFGGISPPARFMTVLVPLLAFYLALVLQQARSWFVTGLFILSTAIAFLYSLVSFSISGGWYSFYLGQSRVLLQIWHLWHINLLQIVPATYLSIQWPLVVGWIVFTDLLTWGVVLLAHRKSKDFKIFKVFMSM